MVWFWVRDGWVSSSSSSLAYPGLANESARPITRSLAAVAILTVIRLGRAFPRAAPLEPADVYDFWLKKHHSSMSPGYSTVPELLSSVHLQPRSALVQSVAHTCWRTQCSV